MHALMLGLLLLAGAVAGRAASGLIEPPFVRKWSAMTGDDTTIMALSEGIVYYFSANGVGAIDQESGREKWHALLGKKVKLGVEKSGVLWVVQPGKWNESLISVDCRTGRTQARTTFKSEIRDLTIDADSLYVVDVCGVVTAYDPTAVQPRWTKAPVPVSKQRLGTLKLLSTGRILYLDRGDLGHFGLDPKTGSVLWQHKERAGSDQPRALDGDVLIRSRSLTRLDATTGRVVWTWPKWYSDPLLVGDVILGSDDKGILAIGKADGKLRWRKDLPGETSGYWGMEEPNPIVGPSQAWLLRKPYVCVDGKGTVLWSRDEPFHGNAQFADSSSLYTCDLEHIFCYRHGSLPPLPTDPRARAVFAKAQVARYELLDAAERKQLEQLKPHVFRPLVLRLLDWDRLDRDSDLDHPFSSTYYSLVGDCAQTLLAVFQKEDTTQLLSARRALPKDSSSRGTLDSILQAKGDSSLYVRELIADLKRTPRGEQNESPALSAVVHSSHPAAVSFMLEAMRDPKASVMWKIEAFRHLAGTGSERGIAAVRAVTPKRRPLAPWYDRVKFTDIAKSKPDIRMDANGRSWIAFRYPVLGNENDLFIAPKTAKGWGRPVFTGVWSGRVFGREAPKLFRGIPTDQVVKSEWITLFPDDPEIRKDKDGDTLTDVVEARLGTDPNKADTDGDGMGDAVDPCPNAAPRALGDTEKIVAAAVTARFFLEGWQTPAVIGIGGIKPLELYGYNGQVMWSTGTGETPLAEVYGGGVNTIGFHSPKEEAKDTDPDIEFGPDKRAARTIISRYSGGLNGDGTEVRLKKIGDEWFVVDMIERYVS